MKLRFHLVVVVAAVAVLTAGCDAFQNLFGIVPEFHVEFVDGDGVTTVDWDSGIEVGDVEWGTSRNLVFRVVNDDSRQLDVTGIDCSNFEGEGFSTDTSVGESVMPGESLEFTVLFAAQEGWGGHPADVSINVSGQSDAWTFVVVGYGIEPLVPDIAIFDVGDNELVSGQDSIWMGTWAQSATADTISFPVRNHGTAALNINSVYEDPAGMLFYHLNDWGIDAGSATTLGVSVATDTTGAHSATLTVESDDPDEGTFVVQFDWLVN
ncbi:MAG: choice-of-anchor D domain-containing protein [Spirochaetota bacterium]